MEYNNRDDNRKDRGIGPTATNKIRNSRPTKKYCRFKRNGIKYIDYKDPDFLWKFLNDQGKMLPRRLTGTSLKYQRRLSTAVKRGRHLGLLPFVTDKAK